MRTMLLFVGSLALPIASVAQPAATVLAPPGPGAPAFEVASVKPGNPDPGRLFGFMPLPNGRLRVISVPVSMLIEQSYRLRSFQLIGAPEWTRSSRVDIEARAPEGTSPAGMMAMMRQLLADRFTLQAHVETREIDILALVLARPGQPAALTRTPDDCDAILAGEAKRLEANPNAMLQGPTAADGRRLCAGDVRSRVVDGVSMLEYASGGVTMAELAEFIGSRMDSLVADRTGLTGRFNFELVYSRQLAGPLPSTASGPAAAAVDPGVPIGDAVLGLGLRLQKERGPIQVLVVDRIERPTAD